ncbi:ATP-binding protein [Ferrimonas balearica]|uniref:ATP-binding protein n=1 Tax=Ferrimonas balearica TaxID=44012 RepID=UPI001C9A2831|nr:ATP-binding protein [Ferrimonas balearica]MBY5990771.1 ATP-binding protein [Ferrimonas balearica]
MKSQKVCIVGPDGAGKSSILSALQKKLNDSECVYFGYGESRRYNKKIYSLMKKARSLGRFGEISVRLLVSLDDVIKSYSLNSTNKVVLIDRFPFDNVVNCKIDGRRTYVYHKAICKVLSKPSLVILLSGNAKVIANRKSEISESRTHDFICEMEEYLVENRMDFLKVNTTSLSLEESVSQIISSIKS